MSSIEPRGQEPIVFHDVPRLARSFTAPALCEQMMLDVRALTGSRANALIIGDQFAVRRALNAVWPSLKKGIVWAEGARLSLPLGPCGTLILEEIDRLNERDQAELAGWLNASGRPVRVLATSPRPLFPLVEAGSFLDSLYYRLNHLLIAAT